jgi:hypothetical protein
VRNPILFISSIYQLLIDVKWPSGFSPREST